jgi:hypothetical protein
MAMKQKVEAKEKVKVKEAKERCHREKRWKRVGVQVPHLSKSPNYLQKLLPQREKVLSTSWGA